jgi:hypothetical protein
MIIPKRLNLISRIQAYLTSVGVAHYNVGNLDLAIADSNEAISLT